MSLDTHIQIHAHQVHRQAHPHTCTQWQTHSNTHTHPNKDNCIQQTNHNIVFFSILFHTSPIFLYACESWTLTAELQRRIQAIEMRHYHKILHISYREVCAKIQQAIGQHKDLLTMVKRRKLQWYGHVIRSKPPCKAQWKGEEDNFTRQTEEKVGRQHQGMDRPGVRQVPEGCGKQGKMEKTGCEIICGAPATLAVKG